MESHRRIFLHKFNFLQRNQLQYELEFILLLARHSSAVLTKIYVVVKKKLIKLVDSFLNCNLVQRSCFCRFGCSTSNSN